MMTYQRTTSEWIVGAKPGYAHHHVLFALAGIVMAEQAVSEGTWRSGEMFKQRLGMLISRRPGDAGATIK